MACCSTGCNTQPPEGGCRGDGCCFAGEAVSTHSRPKAAAVSPPSHLVLPASFNTQPPEGGCGGSRGWRLAKACFNTQPPEGGCVGRVAFVRHVLVSTHSRPKAAAPCNLPLELDANPVSTHSRPKAAARGSRRVYSKAYLFQHTAARRRLPCSQT